VKALVTGATGLLGTSLVDRLRADGVKVRALVHRNPSALGADELCEGDLGRPETLDAAVNGVDWVFHAGARVATTGAWQEFEEVNVRGMDELIARAVSAGVSRIVHVSSLSVYDVPHEGAIISEDGPFEAAGGERGFYARSKLAADQIARDWIARGAPVVIIRPGLLYGPGRRPPLARRVIGIRSLRLILASPDYLLPLSYTENVCEALMLAARTDAALGRAYTVVDEHVRQAEYTRLFRRVSRQNWRPVYMPVGLILRLVGSAERVARIGRVHLPVTRHQVERTVRSAIFSTRRIRRELGWSPRVPLEEALRRSFTPMQSTVANSEAAQPKA